MHPSSGEKRDACRGQPSLEIPMPKRIHARMGWDRGGWRKGAQAWTMDFRFIGFSHYISCRIFGACVSVFNQT